MVRLPPGEGYLFIYQRPSPLPSAIARPHRRSITAIAHHPTLPFAVSADAGGGIEVWTTRGGVGHALAEKALSLASTASTASQANHHQSGGVSGTRVPLPYRLPSSPLARTLFYPVPAPLVSWTS